MTRTGGKSFFLLLKEPFFRLSLTSLPSLSRDTTSFSLPVEEKAPSLPALPLFEFFFTNVSSAICEHSLSAAKRRCLAAGRRGRRAAVSCTRRGFSLARMRGVATPPWPRRKKINRSLFSSRRSFLVPFPLVSRLKHVLETRKGRVLRIQHGSFFRRTREKKFHLALITISSSCSTSTKSKNEKNSEKP